MDAMSRARTSSAVIRAASSICSHGGTIVGAVGLGGSDSSRNARCNCMAASLMRRRLRGPAEEGVDERAQAKQIIEPAEIVGNVGSWGGARLHIPIRPGGRNERAGAVRQCNENETYPAPPDAVDYRKRAALKWVTLARNHHRFWEILEVGSLSCLPSTKFRMTICSSRSLVALRTVLCCG